MLSTADLSVSDTFTYALVGGDPALFSLNGSSLMTAASFDYEACKTYTIRVRSTDQQGFWFEKEFTIAVTDVNEAPQDIALSNTSVVENQLAGTVVGVVSGTDPDAGQSATLIFDLVSGVGDNSWFIIDPVTGELKTTASFDYEARSTYTIRVRSTDQGGIWFEKEFTIAVTDVTEAP